MNISYLPIAGGRREQKWAVFGDTPISSEQQQGLWDVPTAIGIDLKNRVLRKKETEIHTHTHTIYTI